MTTAPVPPPFQPDPDDWMAIANAVGVTAPSQAYLAEQLSDLALDVTTRQWAIETKIGHGRCHGELHYGTDCQRIICDCLDAHAAGESCPGTTDRACAHGWWLCDECRPCCEDCRIDASEPEHHDGRD